MKVVFLMICAISWNAFLLFSKLHVYTAFTDEITLYMLYFPGWLIKIQHDINHCINLFKILLYDLIQYDMAIKNQMQRFLIPQDSLRYKKRQFTFNCDQRTTPQELISPQSVQKVIKVATFEVMFACVQPSCCCEVIKGSST